MDGGDVLVVDLRGVDVVDVGDFIVGAVGGRSQEFWPIGWMPSALSRK